jgi:ADP-heptose:LPS heptosyltransferase
MISLQTGPRAYEAAALGLDDLSPHLTDFAETAALVANLDLVITVDTAVAHLAGALGVPTWTMLPHAPDWRWLAGRDDTPWYSTMRLFRQTQPGDWIGLAGSVAAALQTATAHA